MTTNIEWTRNPDGSKGETWPVCTGCTPCSIGCTNCFAARMAATRLRHHPRYEGLATIKNGRARWTGEVRLNHDVLEQPLHWRKPRRVFIASMSDLFHDDALEQFIFRVLKVTRNTPQHTYQILTKRPGRMAPVMREYYARLRTACGSKVEEPQRNLWLGVSIENQAAADERIQWLLQTPAAVRFVSVEPMLTAVDLWPYLDPGHYEPIYYSKSNPTLSWVICGGESGPGARPMHPDWARSLRDQCQAAGVPYFFKAWGAFTPYPPIELCRDDNQYQVSLYGGHWPIAELGRHACNHRAVNVYRVGKKAAGHLLDGREHQEFPKCS